MNRAVSLLLVLLIAFSSCKTSKKATGTVSVKPEKMAPQALLDSVEKHHINFEWFSAKAKVDFDNGKRSENFTANIRMRKDSVIWMSITSLMGIEVFRLLITKDSVEILDRLKKEHTKKSFAALESVAPFPMDIHLLQDILVGNYLIDTSGTHKAKVEKDHHLLQIENAKFDADYLVNAVTYVVDNVSMKDNSTGHLLNADLEDYKTEGGHEFSYERLFNFKGKGKVKLHIRYSRLTWNEPLTFPFFIGDKYD